MERTLVLGHRGAPRQAPENTLAAFAAALAAGADGVELDVHRTLDGALVVRHDPAAPELGTLAERTLAEVRDALPDAPLLSDVLDVCAGALVNIEIKNMPDDPGFDPQCRAADAIVALLAGRGARDRVLISSFHLPAIDRVVELDPSVRTGYLVVLEPDPVAALEMALTKGHAAVHPWLGAMNAEVAPAACAHAAALGLDLAVWTVNDEAEIARLAAAGVTMVITDVPDVASRVVRESRS